MKKPKSIWDDEVRFGKNLKAIINCLGITQAEVANRSGLTPAAVSQIVNGEREPTLKTINKLIRALGCTFERLVK